jgi:hypothetical protein
LSPEEQYLQVMENENFHGSRYRLKNLSKTKRILFQKMKKKETVKASDMQRETNTALHIQGELKFKLEQ